MWKKTDRQHGNNKYLKKVKRGPENHEKNADQVKKIWMEPGSHLLYFDLPFIGTSEINTHKNDESQIWHAWPDQQVSLHIYSDLLCLLYVSLCCIENQKYLNTWVSKQQIPDCVTMTWCLDKLAHNSCIFLSDLNSSSLDSPSIFRLARAKVKRKLPAVLQQRVHFDLPGMSRISLQ